MRGGAIQNTLLQPGRTCWRVERAGRIRPLVDAEAYFRAVSDALSKARYSVLVLGWDLEPRTRLVRTGDHRPPSGTLQDLLEDLVTRRPELRINVLIWDMSLFVAVQHPTMTFRMARWTNPDRLRYELDGQHPLGACHHQKVIVVDDSVAFCGGMDIAGDRWDTRAHHDRDPLRRKPDGSPYPPHHDVALAVDGPAARALGDLARHRWRRATGERLEPPPCGLDAWPDCLDPVFTELGVGIARTLPVMPGQDEVREVEALYRAAIRSARRTIYIENQYFTCNRIGAALAERLGERDGPEVVVVCPERSPSYFDHMVMDPLREQLQERLRASDRYGRLRIYAPRAQGGTPVIVHSKVLVVDDRLVRIGSANLNDRSMGFDTECDLAFEAASEQDRRAVAGLRDDLLAEHLGVPAATMSGTVAETGSLVRAVESLRREHGRSLYPVGLRFSKPVRRVAGTLDLGDPSRPPLTGRRPDRLAIAAALGGLFVGLWLCRPR